MSRSVEIVWRTWQGSAAKMLFPLTSLHRPSAVSPFHLPTWNKFKSTSTTSQFPLPASCLRKSGIPPRTWQQAWRLRGRRMDLPHTWILIDFTQFGITKKHEVIDEFLGELRPKPVHQRNSFFTPLEELLFQHEDRFSVVWNASGETNASNNSMLAVSSEGMDRSMICQRQNFLHHLISRCGRKQIQANRHKYYTTLQMRPKQLPKQNCANMSPWSPPKKLHKIKS